jgi:hypothetical protein
MISVIVTDKTALGKIISKFSMIPAYENSEFSGIATQDERRILESY